MKILTILRHIMGFIIGIAIYYGIIALIAIFAGWGGWQEVLIVATEMLLLLIATSAVVTAVTKFFGWLLEIKFKPKDNGQKGTDGSDRQET